LGIKIQSPTKIFTPLKCVSSKRSLFSSYSLQLWHRDMRSRQSLYSVRGLINMWSVMFQKIALSSLKPYQPKLIRLNTKPMKS